MPATRLSSKQIKSNNTDVKIANYTATDKETVLVDSTAGAFNVTLPVGVEGMSISVQDVGGNATTNNVTIVGTINGNVNHLIDENFGNVDLLFSDGDWIITSKEPSGGGGGGGGHTILWEGATMPTQPALDFVGGGVSVTNDVGKTTITIAGGGGGGGLTTVSTKTANYTAGVNEDIPVNPSAGSFNVTLPLGPVAHGSKIRIVDVSGVASANPVSIIRNGNPINAVAADVSFDIDFGEATLTYYSIIGWILT